jgi:hypothetical protein
MHKAALIPAAPLWREAASSLHPTVQEQELECPNRQALLAPVPDLYLVRGPLDPRRPRMAAPLKDPLASIPLGHPHKVVTRLLGGQLGRLVVHGRMGRR